ncbi:HupE/UreJ family protein [Flavobacterium sp. SUN046]|uniref:HupE/UreJ family protein n=1 Tax=Flavobacterium sp. SUN046 TaxID=3002440 RepID=UPI002DB77A12|nr:HupE/UreJ family protein [Flavobacterium sp. SUN046]MEC4047919.1 HupE/UreJ family protein [Flavobacterium sp. SUN046]
MPDFWIFYKVGLNHVLDLHGYDHLLFLTVLTAPYILKDWKRLLVLVSIFTLGHTISLFLSAFNIIKLQSDIVELLIPITIFITAFYNLITAGKTSKKESVSFIGVVTLLFGIIHGLGFSNYFNSLLPGKPSEKLAPLLEFALGIESAQIIVVLAVFVLSFIVQTLFKFNRRDFILILSSFVIGVVVPLLINNPIWGK